MVNKMTASVKDMLWGTDLAMRSVMILHRMFPHPSAAFSSHVDICSQITGATSTFTAQPTAQAHDFYIGIPNRPSPFFITTVGEFEIYLAECWRWIEESEQLLHLDTKSIFSSWGTLLEGLPSVLSNIYDYFINTAAKVTWYLNLEYHPLYFILLTVLVVKGSIYQWCRKILAQRHNLH